MVARWRPELRSSDHLGRIGGEEFAFILPETDAIGAALAAERLREVISASPVNCEGTRLSVKVSMGVTVCDPRKDSLESAMARADDALYEAKRAGRDRFVLRAA